MWDSVMKANVVDVTAAAATLGSILGLLPPIAALFAIVMYSIQIWESETVKGWVRRWQNRKK